MGAVHPLPAASAPAARQTGTAVSPQMCGLINQLRFVAMRCRAKRRTDLFEACALLQITRPRQVEAYAEALMRCIGEALGRPARLHAPGTAERSFDEAWLAALAAALRRGDSASAAFLLGRHVAPQHRRLIRFLMGRISETLPQD